MKRKLSILLLCLATALLAITFLTPQSWHWRDSNLQVKFFHRSPVYPSYSDVLGFGWSKLGLCLGDWSRAQKSQFHDETSQTRAWISGFSPKGVWITVHHSENDLSFTKRFFVPSQGSFREDLSPGTYLTAQFE